MLGEGGDGNGARVRSTPRAGLPLEKEQVLKLGRENTSPWKTSCLKARGRRSRSWGQGHVRGPRGGLKGSADLLRQCEQVNDVRLVE